MRETNDTYTAMPTFYIRDERHTLPSALRPNLEALCEDDFVSCSLMHPMDNHVEVVAPSDRILRIALLKVKEQIQDVRTRLARAPPAGSSGAPAKSTDETGLHQTVPVRRGRSASRRPSTIAPGPSPDDP